MDKEENYDYIIAGAGAAGLSLLAYLMDSAPSLPEKKVLVIDASLEPEADKTWCFWNQDHRFMELTHHTWKTLQVVSNGEVFKERLTNFGYHCIRSEQYRRHILERARQAEQITLLETRIHDFGEQNDRAIVHTAKGNFVAEWVFQSVLKPDSFHQAVVDSSLIQHFKGWEIETDRELFDPATARLMDFDTEQEGGLTFFYVLPFSQKTALVEYTIFSEQMLEENRYDSALGHYLQQRYGLGSNDYNILRSEAGAIPMEDRKVPGFYNRRTLNIGTVGGITKPTTGYTFTRAHQHSREIVRALAAGRNPAPWPGSPYRFRVYDIMLLYLLKHETDISRHIFHELFNKNSIELLLRFLDEETKFTEELGIFSKLPYAPFFRSIYRMKHRIFTGA